MYNFESFLVKLLLMQKLIINYCMMSMKPIQVTLFSLTWRLLINVSDTKPHDSVTKILGTPYCSEKSFCEGHNLFCHDCKTHCKMRKLNHLGILEKTENFKLYATHNTRKQKK